MTVLLLEGDCRDSMQFCVGDQEVQTCNGETRNKRSVWTLPTAPFKGAHFAVFPPRLIEPCVLACSRPGDTVLDPFCGSGTTGMVARKHGRSFIGCDLNPEYLAMARTRIET